MMRPVTASSAPARVALIALVLAAVTSCGSGTPAASPVPAAGTGSAGPASVRIGELPGHWYIDVRT